MFIFILAHMVIVLAGGEISGQSTAPSQGATLRTNADAAGIKKKPLVQELT
jgi:hypothetical protein